jgi:hypothetical protein
MDRMAHLLTWPKRRALTAADGVTLIAFIEPGRLELHHPDGRVLTFTDPGQLRAFAMQVHVAAVEHDHEQQYPPGQGRAHLKHQRRAAANRQRSDHANQEATA